MQDYSIQSFYILRINKKWTGKIKHYYPYDNNGSSTNEVQLESLHHVSGQRQPYKQDLSCTVIGWLHADIPCIRRIAIYDLDRVPKHSQIHEFIVHSK